MSVPSCPSRSPTTSNGHHYIERELLRRKIAFRKDDNAFLAVADPAALQAAADGLSADLIRKRLDYWTWLLGPKFSQKDREAVTDGFAAFEAEALNVHVDFPLFQRMALPVTSGHTRVPGIKIQDTRMIRLMEVLLHRGTQIGGWRTAQIHQAILSASTCHRKPTPSPNFATTWGR